MWLLAQLMPSHVWPSMSKSETAVMYGGKHNGRFGKPCSKAYSKPRSWSLFAMLYGFPKLPFCLAPTVPAVLIGGCKGCSITDES